LELGRLADPRLALVARPRTLRFDLTDLTVERGHHRGTVVDDVVDDGVEHRGTPAPDEVGALLDAAAHLAERIGSAVTHPDDE
jgi:hypothetical protein